MSPHVPAVDGRTQLSWLFSEAGRQLADARKRVGELPAQDGVVEICSVLDNLKLALNTLDVMANNFEAALTGMLGVVVANAGLEQHHVDALVAPVAAELGEWYTQGTLAELPAEGRVG